MFSLSKLLYLGIKGNTCILHSYFNDITIFLFMTVILKREAYLRAFQALHHKNIKFQGPLILKMFGVLNDLNFRNENRYILCNFIDQNSDKLNIEDIYTSNNEKTLNQLFILAFNKAKEYNLLNALYDEYVTSINAIANKKDFQENML